MDIKDLSPELRTKALACKSSKELLELAESEGIELTEEQLQSVAGGGAWGCDEYTCDEYDPYDW